jgi:hypothetical protein
MRLFGIRIDAKGSWTRSAVLLSDAIVPVSRSPLSSHTTTGGPGVGAGLGGADAVGETDGDGDGDGDGAAGGTGCAKDVAATRLAAITAAHRLTSGARR